MCVISYGKIIGLANLYNINMEVTRQGIFVTLFWLTQTTILLSSGTLATDAFVSSLLTELKDLGLSETRRCDFYHRVAKSDIDMGKVYDMIRSMEMFDICQLGAENLSGAATAHLDSDEREVARLSYLILEDHLEQSKRVWQ